MGVCGVSSCSDNGSRGDDDSSSELSESNRIDFVRLSSSDRRLLSLFIEIVLVGVCSKVERPVSPVADDRRKSLSPSSYAPMADSDTLRDS